MANIYELDCIRPVIDPSAFVHPEAVVIGDVIIGAGCYIAPGAVLRGDFGRITVHKGANVQDNCVMHGFPGTGTVIEKHGHVGHGAVIHDEAVIGSESIVAAMAFIRAGEEFAPRSLIVGIPANKLRDVTDAEVEWKNGGTRDYQELARRSLASMKSCEPLVVSEPNRPFMPTGESMPKHSQGS